MAKLLDALFVFQLLLLFGAILLLTGVGALSYGVIISHLGLIVAGGTVTAGGLLFFATAHIGRALLQISSSNAAILEKLTKPCRQAQ